MAQLHFGTGNSTTFGTTGSATSPTASFNRSDLSNMQIGDLLVAYIHFQSGTTNQALTAPSGWIQYGPLPGQPTWPITRNASIFYYAITSQAALDAIPSAVTWSTDNSFSRVTCVVARATGIDLDVIVDVESSAVTAGGSNATSIAVGGITTIASETLLVGFVFHHNSASTVSPSVTNFMTDFEEYKTAPTGSTLANSGAALGYADLTSSGATGNITASFDGAATVSGGALVSFVVGPWTPPAPVGKAIKYTSAQDTLSDGQLFYTSATDTLAVPAEVRPFPVGYSSVSDMLSNSPFYIAHRGGSRNWPEMSLYAYTQAGFWGAGALEISLARTSDGVWFGLHDSTLDRTSGTTDFIPSEHTWSEIQAYSITAAETTNTSQATRPYMRWEELIEAYYSTHVIMIDPKDAVSHRNELLDMMDELPGTPTSRLVAKYYGPATTWPNSAKARGYTTWGYFYEVNEPNISTYQASYDILGMDYSANSSTWTTVLSFGKPVIAHTIVSPANATTALTMGASGMMVAGVQEVIPRT